MAVDSPREFPLTAAPARPGFSAIPTVLSTQGLIARVRRDRWPVQFEDLLDRHVGAACRGAGVDFDHLADILGDDAVSNLRGIAFKDFVSSGWNG